MYGAKLSGLASFFSSLWFAYFSLISGSSGENIDEGPDDLGFLRLLFAVLVVDLPAGGALTRLAGFLGFGLDIGLGFGFACFLFFEAGVFRGRLDIEDEAPLCGDLKTLVFSASEVDGKFLGKAASVS